jgi:hypothetical protein
LTSVEREVIMKDQIKKPSLSNNEGVWPSLP